MVTSCSLGLALAKTRMRIKDLNHERVLFKHKKRLPALIQWENKHYTTVQKNTDHKYRQTSVTVRSKRTSYVKCMNPSFLFFKKNNVEIDSHSCHFYS